MRRKRLRQVLRSRMIRCFDLLDMHYFLTEDDDLGDDEFEEGFYIDLF